jgi:hypothetical protein
MKLRKAKSVNDGSYRIEPSRTYSLYVTADYQNVRVLPVTAEMLCKAYGIEYTPETKLQIMDMEPDELVRRMQAGGMEMDVIEL